jgi:DNA modification methylase
VKPYYEDEAVTLYHGDCREVTEWLEADVLVTDPPYGRAWKQGQLPRDTRSLPGIAGDEDTTTRDSALAMWGADRPALLFGDLMLTPPVGTKQVGSYLKPPDAGSRGAIAGHRRDLEAIYWIGPWTAGLGGRSSLYATAAPSIIGLHAQRYRGDRGTGHPHTKPLDVMAALVAHCPPGIIADPFAGSGSTLVAAKQLGRKAIGVELEERYCEVIAKRLAQGVLDFGSAS